MNHNFIYSTTELKIKHLCHSPHRMLQTRLMLVGSRTLVTYKPKNKISSTCSLLASSLITVGRASNIEIGSRYRSNPLGRLSDSLRLTLVKQILNLACCRRSIQKTECESGRHNNSGWVKNRGRLGPYYVTRPKPPLFFNPIQASVFWFFFCVLPLLSRRLLKHSENRD